jgi:hypothetical protein
LERLIASWRASLRVGTPHCEFQTPKALANFSPGLSQPWVLNKEKPHNAESVGEFRMSSPTLSALKHVGFDVSQG